MAPLDLKAPDRRALPARTARLPQATATVGQASRPLKVLLWSPIGAGTHYHGPAVSIYRLFQAVVARRPVTLDLIHATPEQQPDPMFSATFALPHVGNGVNSFENATARLRYLRAADRWIRGHAHDYDVMLIPASNALTLPPALTASRFGLPVVGRIAAADSELREVTGLRRLVRWTQLRASMIGKLERTVAISREIEKRLLALGVQREKIVYLPNSADCERFRPTSELEKRAARSRFGIPDSASTVVVCVGAVSRRKGQHLIARAIADLPPDCHLLLVGPIRERKIFSEIRVLESAKAKGRIHWSNHIEDVEQAYFASDIFALPSSNEGMPNALVEAMSCGLPALGTRISGITDLIGEDERGLIIARSSEAILAAVSRYRDEPKLANRHGNAARDFITANQSRSATADKMYELLAHVAASRTQAPAC